MNALKVRGTKRKRTEYSADQIESVLLNGPITIAVDTEYDGLQTLTIQTATRMPGGEVVVTVYRSADLPPVPPWKDLRKHLHWLEPFAPRVKLLPQRIIERDISPTTFVRNLRGVPLRSIPLAEGRRLLDPDNEAPPRNALRDQKKRRLVVPRIVIRLVAHFLTADFSRMFGAQFFHDVLGLDNGGAGSLAIADGKLLRLHNPRQPYVAMPAVEYAQAPSGELFEVRLEYRDTNLLLQSGTLDSLAKTFLGTGKVDLLNQEDKAHMARTFRRKTGQVYGYAINDVLATLLVYEQILEHHGRLYREFDHPGDRTPPLRATLGRRQVDFLVEMARTTAEGSQVLSSPKALKSLMRRGGAKHLVANHLSRYGVQTGGVHGGLLYSRSPTQFWHAAPGMLRDVDLSGCYNQVAAGINVYLGQPVVFEPGSRRINLREAVEFATANADQDAWLLRVTGDILAAPNMLIPSTLNCLTVDNYKAKRRRSSAGQDDRPRSKLFSQRIEAGIVTAATWQVIQALPGPLRREYEALRAESIILYPRKLVADGAAEFDQLVQQRSSDDLPWASELDLEGLELRTVEKIDDDYVSLRFPLGKFARRLAELRAQAKQQDGKGAEQTFKLMANTTYGVLGSRHYPTNNVVAANVITATARAVAFAMVQSLNGLQVITDGCTYRRDRIPACTFQECLRLQEDYPLRHADEKSGIPFLDHRTIPREADAFDEWYRQHACHFFDCDAPGFAALVSLHRLEHKQTPGTDTVSFDALACVGTGDYIKCLRNVRGEYEIADAAARGYRKSSNSQWVEWLLETLSNDHLEELGPITEDESLLKLKEAKIKARVALAHGITAVLLPLGLPARKVKVYRIIRPSAFVFQTPRQYMTIDRQVEKFVKRTGAGLEALALRRSYGERHQGSLQDLARSIYELIQLGAHDLVKPLNMTRTARTLGNERADVLKRRRAKARSALLRAIDVSDIDTATLSTGIVVTNACQFVVDAS